MIRSLLAGAIDYAGLFPPAALDMAAAVRNYAGYRAGPDAWALGRFVVPTPRLGELASATELLAPPAAREGDAAAEPWRLSALVAGDGAADYVAIATFNDEYESRGTGWSGVVDAVEARAESAAQVEALALALPRDLAVFVEVPAAPAPTDLLQAIAEHGLSAKIRTGGTTATQFPASSDVARFIRECVRLGVAFKATAGLHHPLRAEYPLTYDAAAARGTMFGFLNVFVAAAAARAGAEEAELVSILEERDAGALQVGVDDVAWRGHRFAAAEIDAVRARVARSFGSCSFEEPLGDLRALGLL